MGDKNVVNSEDNAICDKQFDLDIASARIVSFGESILANSRVHAVHCMIYADWEEYLFLTKNIPGYPTKSAILMQMRFDGHLGFPGGEVDNSLIGCSEEEAGNIIVDALNRELEEEMNTDTNSLCAKPNDYLFTHQSGNGFFHFYAIKVPLEVIQQIERDMHQSKDFGKEVMGIFRIPLYTMFDGYRGFPAFIKNSFIGNSRHQLLLALEKRGIMTSTEISEAVNSSKKYK